MQYKLYVKNFSSSPVRINSHLEFTNHNGFDDSRPSTSKGFTTGSKSMLNGAVKRRIQVNASHASSRKLESQASSYVLFLIFVLSMYLIFLSRNMQFAVKFRGCCLEDYEDAVIEKKFVREW